MSKGILFIGKSASGKTTKIKELLEQEVGDKEVPFVVIDGLSSRLAKGECLENLTDSILSLLPDAKLVFSLQSINSLSAEDLAFAQAYFEIKIAIEGRTFLDFDEDEILIEGKPVRLLAWQKDEPAFFNGMNQLAIQYASRLLKHVYGEEATLSMLHDLLSNVDEFGKETVRKAALLQDLDPETEAKIALASDWFTHKYFDKENDSTYSICTGARFTIKRIFSPDLTYQAK